MDSDNEVMSSIVGRSIQQYWITPEGLHFNLDDGRVVIFVGQFIVSVAMLDKTTLH